VLLNENSKLSNSWICQYWEKYFTFIRDPAVIHVLKEISTPIEENIEPIYVINKKAVWSNEAVGIINKQWEEEKQEPLIKLNAGDLQKGWKELSKMGIPEGAWWVCLHVRTPGFKKRNINEKIDIWDAHRNADISTYKKAIRTIVDEGGWVLRMGDPFMTPLEKMEHVIDYANSDIRSHFMDVFCTATSRFTVVTNSGYQGFSEAFEVPQVLTNYVSMTARARSNKELFIYKMLYSKKEKRKLSFEEGMRPPLGNAICTPNYKSLDVDWIDNNENEINDAVVEMLNRLEGEKIYTKEDEDLQEKFNTLHAKYSKWSGLGRIGNSFIKKYEHLLN
jgi:putative glycosyltransferase (TIGR04372 family)